MREKMVNFMAKHVYCTVSTVNDGGKPESAFVAYSNSGSALFFGTSDQSRKFKNLATNPSVAVVVADEDGEVQFEGQASVVGDEEREVVEAQHIGKNPTSDKYREDPNQQYIKVVPSWIRYIEHGNPDIIEEFTEF